MCHGRLPPLSLFMVLCGELQALTGVRELGAFSAWSDDAAPVLQPLLSEWAPLLLSGTAAGTAASSSWRPAFVQPPEALWLGFKSLLLCLEVLLLLCCCGCCCCSAWRCMKLLLLCLLCWEVCGCCCCCFTWSCTTLLLLLLLLLCLDVCGSFGFLFYCNFASERI